MGDVAYGCAKFALISLVALFAAFCLFALKVELKVRDQMKTALAVYYIPYKVTINNREAAGRSTYESVCFDINITDAKRRRDLHRIALVSGDEDGGYWKFDREYTSMSECENANFGPMG